jgi:two-component system, cell cycle sensor histidine kinase and response regulator CckA
MQTASKNSPPREIRKIVFIYALVGSAWIYLSGRVLWLITDPVTISRIEVFKGLFFILFTSAMLYKLIGNYAGRNAEATRRLAESEARFQTIYHNVNDALLIHDPATRQFVHVNRTMCEMFGYSPAEVLGLQVGDLSLGESPYSANEMQARLDLATRGDSQSFEWRCRKSDGSIFWCEVTLRAAAINDRERIIVTVRDTTVHKEAEEALRQNKEILKGLMEEMPAGVGWSDERGIIQYLNGCIVKWFGYSSADLPTIDELMLRMLPDPHYRAEIQLSWHGAVAESMNNGTPVPPLEAKVSCKDGSLRHVILNTRVVDGRILFIFTDITTWESTQNEILKTQKLESLGLLAGGIAHDFNNILTGILGNISFAGQFLDGAHPARKPMENAEKASLRAAELAHQLLTFAKGGLPVKKRVSVGSLVQESVSLALHGSNVQSMVDIPASVHAVEADEGQLNQAFNNVIINALQSMPQGGILSVKAENLTLDAQTEGTLPPGDYVKVSFTDQGSGISHEDQSRIFDPYFTTKPGGTGLGLASVHSIVTKHGGKVEVSSSVQQGTTFTFYLHSAGEPPAEPLPLPAPAVFHCQTESTVLVMDDEETIRDLAADILAALGYAVTTCSNGEEAIGLYREASERGKPFLAAIMDLTIPAGMGGKEAAQRILAYDPSARLIVSSGYSNDPVMARHGDYGFCAAVVKPYRWADLQQVLSATGGCW